MNRRLGRLLALLSALSLVLARPGPGQLTLEALARGQLRVIDLTHPLNSANPHWPAPGYEPFKLDTLATLEDDGVLSLAYYTPEHYGTHLDAPNHFVESGPSVDQLRLDQLVGSLVVIDVTEKVTQRDDYRLTVEDLADWEDGNGPIPRGAIVVLRTGWGARWPDQEAYRNQDARGVMHFPGFSEEAARFLVERREVEGIGIDTLSVDYGPSKNFIVHHIMHGAGKYHLENLGYLDELPESGAYLLAAPVKIEGGTGGQARAWAILP